MKQNISTLETNLTKVSSGPPSDAQLSKTRELEKKLAEEKSKFTDLEKEQEDLLVCMGKVLKGRDCTEFHIKYTHCIF